MGTVHYKNQKGRFLRDRGESVARAYSSWTCMRNRVKHPLRCKSNGKGYVGKIIEPSWDNFEVFLSDMGVPPAGFSLDRIDNKKGYTKDNCRWADQVTQARNRSCCKLNEEAVKVIRYLYSKGGYTQTRLATAYGVSQVLVCKVLREEVWAHA